jgi:hypothetical protein
MCSTQTTGVQPDLCELPDSARRMPVGQLVNVGWAELAKPNMGVLLGFTAFNPTCEFQPNLRSAQATFNSTGADAIG